MRVSEMFFSWAMRAASIASRAAMSASSSARLRRDFERANALLLGDARRFGRLAGADAGLLDRLVAGDLERPGRLLGGDAVGGEHLLARDLRRFDRLVGGDLRLLDASRARDLERAGALFRGDALGVDRCHLGDAQLFGRLARRRFRLPPPRGVRSISRRRVSSSLTMRDSVTARSCTMRAFSTTSRASISASSTARVRSISCLAHLALRGDARGVDRPLIGDARLVDGLARGNLDFLDRARALDFPLPDVAFAGDARLADRLLVGDAGFFDRLARGNLRLLRFGLAKRALARDLGALHRAPDLDIALLVEPRRFAVALDFQRLPLRLEIAGADLDHRFLFDVIAQFAPGLDVLHQVGQALGVETIGGIEEFEIGLVEVGDRDQLELEPVLRERLGGGGLDAADIFAALLVHLLHRHFGGDRAQRRDELAGEQRMQALGLERASAERRRGDRNRFARGPDADIEVGLDVDAHAVARDQRVALLAHDRHRQHVHVDGREIVNERQHEGAAVDDDALAEEAGAHERHFLRRAMIEPVHDIDEHDDDDDRDDQPEDQRANQEPRHLPYLPIRTASGRGPELSKPSDGRWP